MYIAGIWGFSLETICRQTLLDGSQDCQCQRGPLPSKQPVVSEIPIGHIALEAPSQVSLTKQCVKEHNRIQYKRCKHVGRGCELAMRDLSILGDISPLRNGVPFHLNADPVRYPTATRSLTTTCCCSAAATV